jgi:hypothetical protein
MAKKAWRVRYVATVRGTIEVEADTAEEAKTLAEAEGADFGTCEQTDFEVLSTKEMP